MDWLCEREMAVYQVRSGCAASWSSAAQGEACSECSVAWQGHLGAACPVLLDSISVARTDLKLLASSHCTRRHSHGAWLVELTCCCSLNLLLRRAGL